MSLHIGDAPYLQATNAKSGGGPKNWQVIRVFPNHNGFGMNAHEVVCRGLSEAEARLFAAAPKLLVALKNLLAEADDDGITREGVDAALVAIGEATGGGT